MNLSEFVALPDDERAKLLGFERPLTELSDEEIDARVAKSQAKIDELEDHYGLSRTEFYNLIADATLSPVRDKAVADWMDLYRANSLAKSEQCNRRIKAYRDSYGTSKRLILDGLNKLVGIRFLPPDWLGAFDRDELRDFLGELIETVGSGNLEELQGIIHEWHESAIALQSGVLDEIVAESQNLGFYEVEIDEP